MTRHAYNFENGNGLANHNGTGGHVNPAFSIELENKEINGAKQNGNNQISTKVSPIPQDTSDSTDRQQWDNPIEFLLSCIAMSVGLGNVYRFPFVAYNNGGGAFLIPYLIVLTFIGRPMYFIEMAIGQFSSFGQVKVWKCAPFFKGVGIGSAIGTACVVSYYCSLMALTVFYFFASFQKYLPWTVCHQEWEDSGNFTCDANSSTVYDIYNDRNLSIPRVYFNYEVLKRDDNIDNGIGVPEWRLTLCLLFSWIIICLIMIKGVRSSGKAAYFTALFPYIVLFILLIRGVTLPGAGTGILYFITPDWKRIADPSVWAAAVGQCFFSLSTGFGPIIMFSSYNKFNHNVHRDALIVSLLDTFTSILAGCCIFSVLGNLSERTGVQIKDIADGGAALAFISYPDAIASFDIVPQLFAVLFFLMLFTLGVGSATSLAGGLITIISDELPNIKKSYITIAVCIVGFFSGLIYVCPGGQAMLALVDHFGADTVIYIMSILEIVGLAWVYGLNNIHRDIEFMLSTNETTVWWKKIWWFYWKLCWGIVIPIGLTVILVYALAKDSGIEGFTYPPVAWVFGWLILAVALLPFPVCAIHTILTRKSGNLYEKFLESLRPTLSWGPKNPRTRHEWNNYPRKPGTIRAYAHDIKSMTNSLVLRFRK